MVNRPRLRPISRLRSVELFPQFAELPGRKDVLVLGLEFGRIAPQQHDVLQHVLVAQAVDQDCRPTLGQHDAKPPWTPPSLKSGATSITISSSVTVTLRRRRLGLSRSCIESL